MIRTVRHEVKARLPALVGLCYSFAAGEEGELVEVDGLAAGAAAAGPSTQEGLQQQHRLGQC